MTKLLVTGAAGFVGRHVIAALADREIDIHGIVLPADKPLDPQNNLRTHVCDLLDPAQQNRIFSDIRPSHLLHLAWYTAHGRYWSATENVAWVRSSIGLIENFQKFGGKRVTCAGTCAEYEWGGELLSERGTPTVPATLYGICKNSFGQVLAGYCREACLSWAWGRIFLLYGPHENPDRFVPSVILPIMRGQAAKCTHGRQMRDYLHVEDVASAFVALLESSVQGAVNIASGRPVAIRDIATVIAGKLGRPELLELGALPPRPDEPERIVADTRRLFDEVGWKPKYDLESGIEQAIEWWKKHGNRGCAAGG